MTENGSDFSSTNVSNFLLDDQIVKSFDPSDDIQLFNLSLINACREALALAAVWINAVVVVIFAMNKGLRRSKINWAVCNLMLSNILMCTTMAIYSFVKLADWQSPRSQAGCLALNWFMVAVSFGPTWSVALMTFLRATFYCSTGSLRDKLTLKRLCLIRLCIMGLDLAMATLIIHDVSIFDPPSRCAYQSLLDNSLIYVCYNLLVGSVLLVGGLCSLIHRSKLRNRLLEQSRSTDAEKDGKKSQPVLFTVHDYCTDQYSSSSTSPPSLLWKKPKFIVLFIILGVLFVTPRIAFVSKDRKIFWALATVCPPIIAFIFALIFLTIPKDFRRVTRRLLANFFKKNLDMGGRSNRPEVGVDVSQRSASSSTTTTKNDVVE